MAKPMDVAPPDAAGPSTSYSRPPPPSKPSRHRKRQPAQPRSRLLAPSPTLLSLLATVASASVAEGSPAPPDFLCPSTESTTPSTHTKAKRAPAPTPTTHQHLPATRLQHNRAAVSNIPYKFIEEDGVWKKEEEYYLYGVCAGNGCDSVLDGQISKANNTMPNNNLKSEQPPNLPPGWQPVSRKNTHTMLILAMSLVLAFFICLLIIGCLFWRKNMRRKYKQRDPEKKGRRKRRRDNQLAAEEIREIELEKECQAKQRLWARATARWKANARHSARQRRGKRMSSTFRARPSTTSLDSSRDHSSSRDSSLSPTPTLSRSVSRRSSTSSFHQEPQTGNCDASSPIHNNRPLPAITVSTPDPTTSPPAYQQKSSNTPQADSSDGLYPLSRCASSASLHTLSRRPSHSSPALALPSQFEESPSTSGLAAAHVATDDKNVLARLAELASAPPTADSASELEVSVPEWQDEEIEDYVTLQQTVPEESPSCSIPPSPYPPPPSKGNLLAPDFYDYPFSFEEITGAEPEYGPSAPPFEEIPSAPLVDEANMEVIPSAPPLIDDEDFYGPEQIPSALLQCDTSIPTGTELTKEEICEASGSTAPEREETGSAGDANPPTAGEEARGILPVYRP